MSTSETAKYKVECPFDLEAIFTVSIDTKNLKGIIEFILERLGVHEGHHAKHMTKINELDVKLVQKLMQVDK